MSPADQGTRSMKTRRRPLRGQVLVLACLALFTMAAMLMTSFALTNAIHERVRIQAHADATAYSVATLEARSLNVIAYMNRTIATTMVSMMAVHGWMTIASMTVSILEAGEITMLEIVIEEVIYGCYPYNFSHCAHVVAAVLALVNYMDAKSDYEDKVKDKESAFNDVIDLYNLALKAMYAYEVAVAVVTGNEVGPTSQSLGKLKQTNAKNSSYATAVLAANIAEYQCALENTPTDSLCAKIEGDKHSPEDIEDLSKIMENAANAARPKWERNGCSYACFASASTKFMPNSDYLQNDIQNGQGTDVIVYPLYASTGEEFNKNAGSGDKSVAVGAGTGTGIFAIMGFYCGYGGWTISSQAFSSDSGGKHDPAHDSNHDKFNGMAKEKGLGKANFINFRGDYPNTYAAVQQDLGLGIAGQHVKGQGWEVNDNAKMRVALGTAGTIEVPTKPKGTGNAVAKGVVYFHQPGDWRVQGNLFDPYWHGKLHFFKRAELLKILALSGDRDSAGVGAVGPVEGVD